MPLSLAFSAPAASACPPCARPARTCPEHFATVTQSAVLEHAIVLLMAAAGSGKAKDRKAATDQLVIVLQVHRRAEVALLARLNCAHRHERRADERQARHIGKPGRPATPAALATSARPGSLR